MEILTLKQIRRKMKEYRRERGLSQLQAAQRAGVSRSAWQSWEHAWYFPAIESVEGLARILSVPADCIPIRQPRVKHHSSVALRDRIRQLRKLKGVSQEAASEALGFSKNTFSNWEIGKNTPNSEGLECLANYFKIPVQDLTILIDRG